MQYQVHKKPDHLIEIEIHFSPEDSKKLAADEEHRKEKLLSTFNEIQGKEQIPVLTPPEFTIISEEPYHCVIRFTTLPPIKAPGLENLKAPAPINIEVSEEELAILLDELRHNLAPAKTVERAAQKGDRVTLTYEGHDKGGVVQMARKDQPFTLGTGTLVAPLEAQIMGMKTNDKKTCDVTFPKGYFQKDLAEKTLTFNLDISKVEELETLPLDDELAKKVLGPGKTLEDVKGVLRQDIETNRKNSAAAKREAELLEQIVEKTEIENLPDSLIEDEIDYLLETLFRSAEEKGTARTELEKEFAKEGRDPRVQLRPQARKNVILRLALAHMFQDKQWAVSEDELAAAAEKRIEQIPEEHRKAFKEHLKKDASLRAQLRHELQLNKLIEAVLG